MDTQNFINFKKKRDLGTILSDTFQFLSSEWKPFFGTILKISIIPILIAICAVVYYGMSSVSFLGDFSQIVDFQSAFNLSDFLLPLFAFAFSYLVAYALITVAALAYIKSYIDNKGVVNYEEVQNSTKEKFWPYVGLFFLNGIIVFFGALFCFLPGIYFGIVLSLSICLLIFQNKSVTDAINDSFSFIKGHWWETFGILIVVQLIIIFISFILDLPATLYQAADITSIIQGDASNEILKSFSDPIYLMLIALSYFIKFILYMVATVATVFIYYDIKEQKDPSTEIIDEIGVE
tara:strand:+ start:468 stop:1343 length:876 start_codon:yes stop_codon:yes gene_type:complete